MASVHTIERLSQNVSEWKDGSYADGTEKKKGGGGRETLVMWLCLCLQTCGCINMPSAVFSQGHCAACWQDRDYRKPHSALHPKVRGRCCNAHFHPCWRPVDEHFYLHLWYFSGECGLHRNQVIHRCCILKYQLDSLADWLVQKMKTQRTLLSILKSFKIHRVLTPVERCSNVATQSIFIVSFCEISQMNLFPRVLITPPHPYPWHPCCPGLIKITHTYCNATYYLSL